MSCIMRPNGSPHHTCMPRVKQTREHKARLAAAYDRAEELRHAAYAYAIPAFTAKGITRAEFHAIIGAATAEGDQLIREAKRAR